MPSDGSTVGLRCGSGLVGTGMAIDKSGSAGGGMCLDGHEVSKSVHGMWDGLNMLKEMHV